MKASTIIKGTFRFIGRTIMAILLLVVAILILLYSPWSQEQIKDAALRMMNKDSGTEFALERFSLKFPLTLSLEGLSLIQDGDTVVAARTADLKVALIPLFLGNAEVKEAILTDARYNMGVPDSATYMTIAADSIALSPVKVKLSSMDIDLESGLIRGGRYSLILNPDTAAADTTKSEPTQMCIRVGKLALDDFTYMMRLMPTIDTLTAKIGHGVIDRATIDLFNQKIHVGGFIGTALDARYMTPDSAAIVAAGPYPTTNPADTVPSKPWTVQVDTISFANSRALYGGVGIIPAPGLDFSYIQVEDLDLHVSNFYNQAATVRVPLSLVGTERCGVSLNIDGTLDIDSIGLHLNDFRLNTPTGTSASFTGLMGLGDLAADPRLPLMLKLDGAFAPKDLALMFPVGKLYMDAIPGPDDILLDVDVHGTTGHLQVDELALRLNRCLNLVASGYVDNAMVPDRLGCDLKLQGNIINVNKLKSALLDASTNEIIAVPPLSLDGHVKMHGGIADANLQARTAGGALRLDGRWNQNSEGYNASLLTRSFPLQAFLPTMGVGALTANVNVDGHGYDPFSTSTAINADVDIKSIIYQDVNYTDITLNAKLDNGHADLTVNSANPDAQLAVKADGNLDGDVYNWNVDIDGDHIDLYALKFSDMPSSVELNAQASASIGPGKNDISGRLILNDLYFAKMGGTIGITDVDLHLNGTDSLTDLSLVNRDMTMSFNAPLPMDSLLTRFSDASTLLTQQIDVYALDVDTLGRTLPPFVFSARGSYSNLVNDILAPSDMSVRNFTLAASNDSIFALNGMIRRFETGDMHIDSIFVGAHQSGPHLLLDAGIENRPGNLNEWHRVDLRGIVDRNTIHIGLGQKNLAGDTGFKFGLKGVADIVDSTFTLSVNPFNPIIGYQDWTVNSDNYISYRIPDEHVEANLHMTGGNSSLAIFTEKPETAMDSLAMQYITQPDLVLQLSDIHIADWISFNPFAPPIAGDVNADVRLNRIDGRFMGRGSAGVTNLLYGKERVADMKADFDAIVNSDGSLMADADLYVDGKKTISISGALNDSTLTSPLNLDFAMIHFPLSAANPFLPAGTGRLSGTLNGKLKITGTDAKPLMNGWLAFDSTAVTLALTGQAYKFSPDSITVNESVVNFNKFAIWGCNDNPLRIDGKVDISDLSNMKINLGLKASNMMLVNTSRARKGADIFGKAYVSIDAGAHGTSNLLNVNANVSVTSGTNVTYIVPDATNAIANRANDQMVKFVNFTDSLAVIKADTLARNDMGLILDANLTIDSGTIINVDLSTDGQNRVQLQSNGTLNYTMTPLDEGRLTGRLDINSGYVRYSPPILSELNFNFEGDNYIAFYGDMMNPTINARAVEVKKVNVTSEGQNSRLVNFNVILTVTGTLNTMNVAFDLSTNDDLTVANELESMTPEQRSNQAMSLLLYDTYTGAGTKGDASLSGNPLFSFLQSQINSWASEYIKGVDLSFGIDQYDSTVDGTTSQTTRYTYQVSKSLFNDRFKIVVGGNYSTDANADENFSQNLINDISFEYFLNKKRTMYVRLFRHTGYESILEGEITQTGVGFVYRRKLTRVGDMFLPNHVVRQREERRQQKLEESLNK